MAHKLPLVTLLLLLLAGCYSQQQTANTAPAAAPGATASPAAPHSGA